jgi:hypothetical protein
MNNQLTFSQITLKRTVELINAIATTDQATAHGKALAIQRLAKMNDSFMTVAYDYYQATADIMTVIIATRTGDTFELTVGAK